MDILLTQTSTFDACRLNQIQRDVTTWYEKSLLDLEHKYKILINDLIEQKILIQQKLAQRYMNQINRVNELRLATVENGTSTNVQFNMKHNINVMNGNKNILIDEQQTDVMDATLIKNKKETDLQNCSIVENDNCNENDSDKIDHVNIPIFVKVESIDNDNDNRNMNRNINNDTKFDINKTEERMQIEINTHITRIEKAESGEKYQCNDCNKKFKKMANAQSHIAYTHIDEKPFKCNKCDKCFAMWRFLSQHEIVHSSKYQCQICGKKCLSSSSLENHSRIHTGEKPFKCDYKQCDKSFRLKRTLVKHQTIHNGEKIFICHYKDCGKSFTRKHSLVVHQRIHTGEKPYQCDICKKKFGRHSTLSSHNAYRHSDKKLWYKCDQCDSSFPLKGALNAHKNIHTSKYQCNICGKRHVCKSLLKKHAETAHGAHVK